MLVALAVSGCGFSIDARDPGGDDPPGTQPDAREEPPVAKMCATSDPSLKLCIDFDDSSNLAHDARGHAVTAVNVAPMQRDDQGRLEGAVQIDATSQLWIAETPDLDVREDLTVAMWIKFDIGALPLTTNTSRWLYDNNTQYFASLRFGGVVRCGSGPVNVDSPPLTTGTWHHVACTYEDDEVRVYIDGHVAGCNETGERDLPTSGTDGFAIGANLSGGPSFAEQFTGGIDNVQVFSRLLPPEDVCGAAGQTVCNTTCLPE